MTKWPFVAIGIAALLGVACEKTCDSSTVQPRESPPLQTSSEAAQDPGASVATTTSDDSMNPDGAEQPQALGKPSYLLERHEETSPTAVYLPVQLNDSGLKRGKAIQVPAMPQADRPKHYRTLASYDGGSYWVSAQSNAGGATVVRIDLAGKHQAVVQLESAPASLHLAQDVAVLGIGNQVGFLDFAASAPVYSSVVRRSEMKYKAYDLLVRDGDWLIAIDDVVTPIYADTLRLASQGPAHLEAWEMPSFINGSYVLGALNRTGDQEGTLYAIGRYSIMSGNGQDLVAFSIEDGKLQVDSSIVLNAAKRDDPPVLEEHTPRGRGKPDPRRLIAGTQYTPWTGLALWRPSGKLLQVLLAAGSRGLLLVPPDFDSQTKAKVIRTQGDCLDVLVHGELVYLLLGGGEPAVAAYGNKAGKLSLLWRKPLPGEFHRFVQ